MKKFTFLLITSLLAFSYIGFGQGLENFDNSNANSSYSDGNFVGEDGITWYYVASRDANGDANGSGIALPALMLRRVASGSKVYSETISGGIGNFSVKLYKGFTGGGNRQVELFINGVSQGTSTPFDDLDEHIFTVNNINISGNIEIRIDDITAKQVIVDDITWTAFTGGGNQAPVITDILNTPEVPQSTETVEVQADVTDDGTVSTVECQWGTTDGGPYSTTINMSLDAGDTYVTDSDIPAQSDGTTVYYVIEATDDESEITTSTQQDFTVTDPAMTTLPYNETFDADLGDCYTYSVSGATKEWFWFNTDQAAKITGYNSGDVEEDWLIIPGIDFDSYSNEFMTFDTWYKYGTDGADDYLKLMYSSDYSGMGDPSGSTWTELAYTQPAAAETWASSGTVDLSSISGTSVYIAFKYHYNSGVYRTWEVDNISIQESTTNPEPDNYPTSFAATTNGASAITTDWVDAIGTNLPSDYLVLANLTGNFTTPVDGTPVADDADLSDGEGAMNIAYGLETYQWTGLAENTHYYFVIYPYSNSASSIDYKTDGTPPTDDATTDTHTDPNAWINEFHYDNIGGDVGEFMEIVVENAGSYTLSDLQLDLYNGSGGVVYNTLTLDLFTVGGTEGNYTFYYYDFPANGIQNGPDGFALSYQGILITGQFISYEGTVTATEGPANGETSTDIGVSESNGTTQIGESLQLKGGGDAYDLFSWQDPATETKGALNNKQYLGSYTTFTGTTDNDWATATNWNNGLPDAAINVIVPQDATNFPTISAAATCNNIIIESNEDGNASILGNSNLTVSGTTTVERYFVGHADGSDNGWHNISSPVSSMAIAGSDFEPGAMDDLYWWEESTDYWRNYKANAFDFTDGMGYLCAFEHSGTKNFVGTLNESDITFTDVSFDKDGFHLHGNPFASALLWNNGDWSITGNHVSGTAQIWDEVNADYIVLNANDIIPSTNGFFVEVDDATNSITIPASARVHDPQNNYKSSRVEEMDETMVVRVTNDENTYYNIARIGFRDDATEAWDIEFDAHKLFGGSGTSQLWTVSNNEIFSQNYLPYVYESYQLPLNFRAGTNTTHHLVFEGMESFFPNSEIYLEDVFLAEMIDLREQQYYDFTATTDDEENRFILHFYGVTNTDEKPLTDNINVFANQNTVYIKSTQIPKGQYRVGVYNVMGQLVYAANLEPSTLNSFRLNEKTGIYIVRLQSENGSIVQKIMIK